MCVVMLNASRVPTFNAIHHGASIRSRLFSVEKGETYGGESCVRFRSRKGDGFGER